MNRAVLYVEWRRGVQAILPSNLLAAALLAAALPVAAADAEAESRGSLRQTSPASTPPPAAAPEQPIPGPAITLQLRHYGWIQGVRLLADTGWHGGTVAFSMEAGLAAALKLDGGAGSGDMAHRASGGRRGGWLFPGAYALKAKAGGVLLRYGLVQMESPYLEAKDNRALPPVFRGVALQADTGNGVMLEAGSVDAVIARGGTRPQKLNSAYGGMPIDRMHFAGGKFGGGSGVSDAQWQVYAARATDLWNSGYVGYSRTLHAAEGYRSSGALAWYGMRGTGRRLQGAIATQAYSAALSHGKPGSEWTLSYQRVAGDQYMDYVQEANGLYLANGMVADYNAPREQSVQLRWSGNGAALAQPDLQLLLWLIAGHAPPSRMAEVRAAPAGSGNWRDVYWKSGRQVQGNHAEVGFKASRIIQGGPLQGAELALIGVLHQAGRHYIEPAECEFRFTLNAAFRLY